MLRVLIVEDEPLVQWLAMEALAEAGFETLGAADATEALEILAAEEGTIDILFTDVRMPGPMNGFALARLAKRMWPSLRVLVTSGFFEGGDLPSGTDFLPKPWSGTDLVARMLQVAA